MISTLIFALAVMLAGAAIITTFILFLLKQQKLLAAIRPVNRKVNPVIVWLQLIPFVGTVVQFFIAHKISCSIYAELVETVSHEKDRMPEIPTARPTLATGLAFALSSALLYFNIPYIHTLVIAATFITWIFYWIEIVKYKNLIATRRAPAPKPT